MIFEHIQRINIVSRAVWIKVGVAIVILWLIISLCAKGLTRTVALEPSLIHDEGRLIIPEQSPLRHAVVVQPVVKQLVAVSFTRPATVFADPTRLLSVQSPVTGQFVQINKQLGDYVRRGETLFSIRSPFLAQAVSEVQKADAAVILTKQTFKRQKQLFAAKIASLSDVQQAKNDYEQAISELTRAKAQLKTLHAKNTSSRGLLAESTSLTVQSPQSGYVTELNASTGSYWNDTTRPVLTIIDVDKVYIICNLQEKDFKDVFVGQSVALTLDAYSKPIQSKVDYISPILNTDTRTIEVGILYDNKKGLLKPNMFADAQFTSRRRQCILLPLTAVIQRGFDSVVFVETSPWVFEPRVVQTRQQSNDSIEIVSGLKLGERVAITGGIILND